MLAASLGPDSDHKHISVAENKLKTFVQIPDLAGENVCKAGWDYRGLAEPLTYAGEAGLAPRVC